MHLKSSMNNIFLKIKTSKIKSEKNIGYSTIYSLRLRDSRDSRDSQDSETPETPRLPRLRDSRGFCHITFQFSFISDLPLFQIFQILQILKWKWKWKDPTFAIFLKNMGFKDVEYNIPETLRLPRLRDSRDSETPETPEAFVILLFNFPLFQIYNKTPRLPKLHQEL